MQITKSLIKPTYTKESGLWALDTQSVVPVDSFTAVEQSIIWLPPNEVAGNHKHVREEALIGIGTSALFLWQDDDGVVHKEPMNPNGELYLFLIPPNVPHAVVNESSTDPVMLYEYFSDVYTSVERVDLLQA
jgi:uncharacterized RmlC-like cupin family protein